MPPNTIGELRAFLDEAGVPEGSYVIQELGIGDVSGIGYLDGAWSTYYSERGAYRGVRRYASESEAISAFLSIIRKQLAADGFKLPG